MRDIRDDLIERLDATRAEMASARTQYDLDRRTLEQKYEAKFSDISSRQRSINILLQKENELHGDLPRDPASNAKDLKLPLQEFILNFLQSSGANSKEEIKDAVERAGYVTENESAGRMVHTTLLNIVKSGKVLLMPDSRYEVRQHDFNKKFDFDKRPAFLEKVRLNNLSIGGQRVFHESDFLEEPTSTSEEEF